MDQKRLLPRNIVRAINEFENGNVTKFIMMFRTPIWKKHPDDFIEIVTEHFDIWDSSFREEGNAFFHLTVYAGGPEALIDHDQDPKTFAEEVLTALEPIIPGLKHHYLGSVPSMHWPRHQFSKSGFSGAIRPGQWRHRGVFDNSTAGNMVFAGEQWSKNHAGFMNGAVESGISAAHYINSRLEKSRLEQAEQSLSIVAKTE